MRTVELGRVVKPHGLGGEVKVRLHFSESELLFELKSVLLRRDGAADEKRAIERARATPEGPLVKLAGIDDRTQAEALRGASILVERQALPEPEPGEYYLCDLIGAKVVGPEGELGEVVEVRTHPSVDTIAIALADGTVVEQPLTEPWIVAIDVERRRIQLSSTEGFV